MHCKITSSITSRFRRFYFERGWSGSACVRMFQKRAELYAVIGWSAGCSGVGGGCKQPLDVTMCL